MPVETVAGNLDIVPLAASRCGQLEGRMERMGLQDGKRVPEPAPTEGTHATASGGDSPDPR
jgi:hypothetical protein